MLSYCADACLSRTEGGCYVCGEERRKSRGET